jgi:hypothetical protein
MRPVKGNDGNGGDGESTKKEREALKGVVLRSFAVDPRKVKTFGTVTVSWNVTVPKSPFDISIVLNDETVAPIGNTSRTVVQSTTFTLTAATEHAARRLRTFTVQVDESDCRSKTIEPFPITQPLKAEFDQRFRSSRKFTLKENGTEVTLGEGTINIHVPLELNVPHWFNADMEIFIQLAVHVGLPIIVTAPRVSASVSWTFFENLASVGCGHFIQSGMTQMAETFLADIVSAELVPKVAQAVNDEVDKFKSTLQTEDPAQREYSLTVLVLSTSGLKFTCCPR